MSTRLLPFKGKDAGPDPAWENALFAAQTQDEIDAALALKAQTQELSGGLVAPLDIKLKRKKMQEFGDSPGHDFHGNQWTGGNAEVRDSAEKGPFGHRQVEAKIDGKVVGSLEYTKSGDRLGVWNIHVDPSVRRQGLASQMLDTLVSRHGSKVVEPKTTRSDAGNKWWGSWTDKHSVTPITDPYWARDKAVVASTISLEFGDFEGHPFHGNQWTEGSGSGTKEDPIHVSSAKEAIKLIAAGKYVTMPPHKISILLDRLAKEAKDAKKAGKEAQVIDLCHISVPDSNLFCAESLGIPRIKMPQLGDGTGFKAALTKDGYKFSDTAVIASYLKPTQGEINGGKVAGMMKAIEKNNLPPGRIFVSSDNYVIDGHHRWAAVVGEDYDDAKGGSLNIDVTKIDAPISVLIPYANQFAETSGEGHASLSIRQSLEFYSADQPRDEHGRFGSGGSSDAASAPKVFWLERDGAINTKDLDQNGEHDHEHFTSNLTAGKVSVRSGLYGHGELNLRISDKNLSPQQLNFFQKYLDTHDVTALRVSRYSSQGEGFLPGHSRDFSLPIQQTSRDSTASAELMDFLKTGGSSSPWPPELRSTTEPPKQFPKSAQFLEVLQLTEFGSPDQARDEHGRWTSSGTSESSLIERVAKEGGVTVKLEDGSSPTTGFQVGQAGGLTPKESEFFGGKGRGIIKDFVQAHAQELHQPNGYLGIWHDKSNHEVAVDVSWQVESRSEAVALGKKYDQQAIWDNVNSQEINVGGTGGRSTTASASVQAPEADRRNDGSGTRRLGESGLRRDGSGIPQEAGGQLSVLTRLERAEFYSDDQPRDANGRWGAGYGLPRFKGSVHDSVPFLAEGKSNYIKLTGLSTPQSKNWASVVSDPVLGAKIAADYKALPSHDPSADAAYRQLAKEVGAQYDYLTGTLGVKVDVVAHDPYTNVAQLSTDLEQNHHLAVLGTEATGSHPLLSNDENDKFRAVHDAFGHAAIGRGFDRNGEEAAYQSHAQMFSPLAMGALATETRGQNNTMIYGGDKSFPEQKVAILPVEDTRISAGPVAVTAWGHPNPSGDDDNAYDVHGVHHTSLGRHFPPKPYNSSQIADSDSSDRNSNAESVNTSAIAPLEFGDALGHAFHGNQWTSGTGNPPSPELTSAAKAYQGDKEETLMVRYAADALVTGQRNSDTDGTDRARELLHAIEHSSPSSSDLYRGLVVSKPDYIEGQTLQFAIGSFSESKFYAEGFGVRSGFMTGTVQSSLESPGPVLFTLESGAKALSVDDLTGKHFEHEWVTGGTFQVVSVEPYGPIGSKLLGTSDGQHVTLRQTEVVKIP